MEEDPAPQGPCLSKAAKSLLMDTISSISKADMTFISNEMKEIKASIKYLVELVLWLDWWTVTVQGLANLTKAEDMINVHHLFNTDGKAKIHLVNLVTVNWTNCILKQWHTGLSHFTKDITLEDKRGLHNSLVYSKSELLLLFAVVQG